MHQAMRTTIQFILISVGIVCCCAVLWIAAHWGIADRNYYNARLVMDSWRDGISLTDENLAAALEYSDRAVRLAPSHPVYRDQLARLLTLRYLRTKQPADLETAESHLIASRSVRPASATNWSYYIDLLHFSDRNGPELGTAIIAGVNSGPWEPLMLQAVSRAGVAALPTLNESAQQAVTENVLRGLVSPIPQLPVRTASQVLEHAQGWTPGFVDALANHLSANWSTSGSAMFANTRLSLVLWPILTTQHRQLVRVQLANAILTSKDRRIFKAIVDENKLPIVCPYLPRKQPYIRHCKKKPGL